MNTAASIPTLSPAMDIQFAYNLERMIYFASGQNGSLTGSIMNLVEEQFKCLGNDNLPRIPSQEISLDEKLICAIQSVFSSCAVTDKEVLETIRDMESRHNCKLCPHSATAVFAATNVFNSQVNHNHGEGAGAFTTMPVPAICVLTAHPAKFEDTYVLATGGKLPPPPPAACGTASQLRAQKHSFSWLRKTSIADNSNDNSVGKMSDDSTTCNKSDGWRDHWMRLLKHDLEKW